MNHALLFLQHVTSSSEYLFQRSELDIGERHLARSARNRQPRQQLVMHLDTTLDDWQLTTANHDRYLLPRQVENQELCRGQAGRHFLPRLEPSQARCHRHLSYRPRRDPKSSHHEFQLRMDRRSNLLPELEQRLSGHAIKELGDLNSYL